MPSIQIPIEVEVELVKLHFEVDSKARMVDINNMKVKLMEVDEETLEEEEVEEVVEVNNQIAIQIAITAGNLGTWQRIVIKGSMMHEMESCNKGIMHQLAILYMNTNCVCVHLSVRRRSGSVFCGGTGHRELLKLLCTEQGKAVRAAARGGGGWQHRLATCFFQQLPFYRIHFSKK